MKQSRIPLLTICAALLSSGALAAAPLKVLVITGQHGYDKPAFNAMFSKFEGMQCTIREMGADPGPLFDETAGFAYNVIALYNFNQKMTDKQKANFLKLFDQGVGVVAMHHSIAGFPDWVEYENLIGATYVLKEQTRDGKHYPRPTWKHDVKMNIKVEDKEHPITKGVTDYTAHDETYQGWIYHAGNHLLLSTDNPISNPQIAWTVPHPHARVFFIQLGHDKHSFENENFLRLIRQGIIWAAGAADRKPQE